MKVAPIQVGFRVPVRKCSTSAELRSLKSRILETPGNLTQRPNHSRNIFQLAISDGHQLQHAHVSVKPHATRRLAGLPAGILCHNRHETKQLQPQAQAGDCISLGSGELSFLQERLFKMKSRVSLWKSGGASVESSITAKRTRAFKAGKSCFSYQRYHIDQQRSHRCLWHLEPGVVTARHSRSGSSPSVTKALRFPKNPS